MSCYHPLIAIPDGWTKNCKTKMKVIRSIDLSEVEKPYIDEIYPGHILVPCGKCIGCRLDYSRHWADRMMLELETAKKAIFLTLTYDQDHVHPTEYKTIVDYDVPHSANTIENGDGTIEVPVNFTLDKRDFQLFMKRLRKAFPDTKLRFYAAGEYGDSTKRPHMHMILYGVSIDDFSNCNFGSCPSCFRCTKKCTERLKTVCGRNELGDQYYTSNFLQTIWKNGNVLFSDVSWKTCAYVARYITKKVSGDLEVQYAERNCIKEFALMSRNPGLGYQYLKEHPDCVKNNKIYLPSPDGRIEISIPEYYLRLQDDDFRDKIKERREEAAIESMKFRLENTNLKHLDYLEMCERKKLDAIKSLKRDKIAE